MKENRNLSLRHYRTKSTALEQEVYGISAGVVLQGVGNEMVMNRFPAYIYINIYTGGEGFLRNPLPPTTEKERHP